MNSKQSKCPAMVIAYTVGSMWFCTACGPNQDNSEPVTFGNTLPIYDYNCDNCGHAIQKASVKDEI